MPNPFHGDRANLNFHRENSDKSIRVPDDRSNPIRRHGNSRTRNSVSNLPRPRPRPYSGNQATRPRGSKPRMERRKIGISWRHASKRAQLFYISKFKMLASCMFVNLLGLGRCMNSCMFIFHSRRDGRVVECTALLKGIRDFTMIFWVRFHWSARFCPTVVGSFRFCPYQRG